MKKLTILGIILVLLGIPLIIFVIKNQTMIKIKASNSQAPKDVKITNISDQTFTITYQTDVPATGSISYGNDKKLSQSELENVDKEKGSFSPKKIHSISVNKLIPNTKYYLSIISGSNTFLNNGTPFETTTGSVISSSSAKQNEIKGKIILPDGNVPSEAIVYLNAENSQLLSNTIAKDGSFSFSLEKLRTNDLSSYFDVNDNTFFKIFTTNGILKSTALASLSKINSIPTITLSNDYDFTHEVSTTASKSAALSGFPKITPSDKNLKPEITSPKENQSFESQKPQFNGTSLPNETVEITIHSDEQITTEVTADSKGNWTYSPPNNLSPGTHTITIKTPDSQGILTTTTQSFIVLAAGSQTSGSGTPSATPTTIITPTQTPTPTVAISIPTSTPIIFPSPTLVPIGSKGGLPPTGNSSIFLIVGGIVTTIFGLTLFLLTQSVL